MARGKKKNTVVVGKVGGVVGSSGSSSSAAAEKEPREPEESDGFEEEADDRGADAREARGRYQKERNAGESCQGQRKQERPRWRACQGVPEVHIGQAHRIEECFSK